MEPTVTPVNKCRSKKIFVSIEMQIIGEQGTYLCTNVYGPQRLEDKLRLLKNLSQLKSRHTGVRGIYGGDFNMIISLEEKKGGLRKLNRDVEAFRNFSRAAKLVDIHPVSGLYTWNNKCGGDRKISSWLDCFLISEDVIMAGVDVEIDILPS